ncbi:non-ribosomal peptide synthetase [Brucella pituitosa]|uniref:non-ribosomal peptide synthetase n=1 Tax=Brucella pituitosa TaxID=571256 RepID=UPI0015E3F69D
MRIRTIQEKIIHYSLSHQDDPTYNMGLCLHFCGPLDLLMFKESVIEIISASPIYSLNFVLDGKNIVQVERNNRLRLQFDDMDISHLYERSAEEFVTSDAQILLEKHFDLTNDPLIRLRFYWHSSQSLYVAFVLHHSIGDAFSAYSHFRKIVEVYTARKTGALINPYIASETDEDTTKPDSIARSVEALRKFINGATSGVLNADADAPNVESCRRTVVLLNKTEKTAFCDCAERLHVRKSTLSLVFFALVRARVRGQRQFVITLPFSGRTRNNKNFLGCFVNVLPLFIDLEASETIEALCASIDCQLRFLMRHQHITIEDHADQLFQEKSIGALRQIYNAVFTYYSSEMAPFFPQVTTRVLPLASPNFSYPISWVTWDVGDNIHIEINSSSVLFQAADLEAHVRSVAIAFSACTRIDDILLYGAVNSFHKQFFAQEQSPTETIPDVFSRQVVSTPDLIAVTHRGRHITYRELDKLANSYAAGLTAHLSSNQHKVVICMDRGPEQIAAILGVLKTGRAYVPVEPLTPTDRLDYILEDLDLPPVVTQSAFWEKFASLPRDHVFLFENLAAESYVSAAVTPGDIAYVIFTSGSSGRPKGVQVSHGNVTRLFSATANRFGFGKEDIWLQFHSYAFDFSVWEIFGALLFGGRLVIADSDDCKDCDSLSSLLVAEGVTVLNQTPTAFIHLSKSILSHPKINQMALRQVIFGGERLNPNTLAEWIESIPLERTRLTNMYGITETTIHVTHHDITITDITGSISNIGGPIQDLSLYIINDAGTLAQINQVGEIAVAGPGVSQGYLVEPKYQDDVFVPNPVEPLRFSLMYRTGDLARYAADGTVHYVGRRDRQVQLRGYRIELSEIETALLLIPGVRACSVNCFTFPNSEKRLVAHYVTKSWFDPAYIRERLRRHLPIYMIPAYFVALDELPMTLNGKIDQLHLEADFFASLKQSTLSMPSAKNNDLALQIASIWNAVLGHDVPSHQTGFFDAGGDSLMMNILTLRLRELLPQEIAQQLNVAMLLDRPTIHAQVELIRSLSTLCDTSLAIESRAQQRLSRRHHSRKCGGLL